MAPFEAMRDLLRSGCETFAFLDAAQLVRHAFGLVTEAKRKGKTSLLVYLYAEPAALGGKPIPVTTHRQHREEISRFAAAVRDAEVSSHSIGYRKWLTTWPAPLNEVGAHARAVIERFAP
jgi:hypothetical protein